MMNLAGFPTLAANIVRGDLSSVSKRDGEPLARPYIVKNIGELRVAVIGLTVQY